MNFNGELARVCLGGKMRVAVVAMLIASLATPVLAADKDRPFEVAQTLDYDKLLGRWVRETPADSAPEANEYDAILNDMTAQESEKLGILSKPRNASMSDIILERLMPPAFVLGLLLLAWPLGYRHEVRKRAHHPNVERQSYIWGYVSSYFLLGCGIVGLIVSLIMYGSSYSYTDEAEAFRLALWSVFVATLGVFVMRRNRWTFLIYTVLGGPPSWIINGLYLSHRWREMRDIKDAPLGMVASHAWSSMPLTYRGIVAGGFFWVLCVAVGSIIFSHEIDGSARIICTMTLPPLLAGLAVYLWKQTVKPPPAANPTPRR